MKTIKNNLAVFLMALSQLLLTLFVVYWLIGQFEDEKRSLYRELRRGFESSERMMIDSLLSTHLINPILNDSSKNPIVISNGSDSILKNDLSKEKTIIRSFDAKGNLERINIIDTHNLDSLRKVDSSYTHLNVSMDTTQSYLYQGVGLFVKRIEGMDHGRSGRASFFRSRADTSVLKNSYINYLQENGFDFSLSWISGKVKNEVNHDGIMLYSRVFDKSFSANVQKYQSYLFASIIPQILFAIILLLITLASFRISHLNIKKQKRLLHIKNEFISNITHELKTPVATVKVALEALLDFEMKKDPAVVQEYLEMSLQEMNRLDLLVSKVLNNSVLENGNELFFPEKVNLNSLIESVIKSQYYRLHNNGASLEFKSEIDEAYAMVDKIHMQGVLLNLIDNSMKYAVEHVNIYLNLSLKSSNFVISVKDNGSGIPTEYIDKVFDKFFRVPTNDKHNVKGYGLGLNYAKLVMQHHKGSIKVHNLLEGGCEFVLTIPIIES